ncbi:MAG: hypothetical protein ACTHJW_18265 [Streptosporangiaceae bacterium]
MPKTVLIILAAVVALIVIVVLTGMRYLRADDEDDFDNDAPAGHGRSRSRGSHKGVDQSRPRERHSDDLADERARERVGAARGARPVQGRTERSADRRGLDQRDVEQRGSSRAGQDRSWREDSAITTRSGRAASPARDQRAARNGRRDHDDISEPMPAARSTRASGRGRGGDDYDSSPGRRTSPADYDSEPRDRRSSRNKTAAYDDDFAGRRDGRDPRETRDRRGDSRPGRDSRDRTDLRDGRPAASIRHDSDRDERDRRTSTRPNPRPDARKNGSKPDDELLPAVKPRQSKNKRESEGDWPSNEWDELSDVDYWAELASDKPFTAPSSADTPRSERREARADREAKSDRAARGERATRLDREPRAGREARHDSRAGSEAITKQMSRPPREHDSGILPAARHRDLAADRPAAGRTEPRQAIADDDPLTSPSFPRVAADDSRSYRRSRSAASDSRYDGSRGFDGASTTRRHALPASASDLTPDAYLAPAGYQVPAATGAHQTPAASYMGPDGANGSYPAPGHYSESGGYHAPASYPSAAGGYPPANGSPEGGYLPPVGGTAGFAAETSSGSYHSLPPAPDGYRSDLGSGSYRAGARYEATGYESTSSYSLPPASASYGNGTGQRAAEYPANGYQAGDYETYGRPASTSGAHRRPEPGYPQGSYPGAAEPSVPAVYPAPVPNGQNGYGPANPQPAGYGGQPYQPGGYDQDGYQLPAGEENGYAGADPYAVDPYGQHGYGTNGY